MDDALAPPTWNETPLSPVHPQQLLGPDEDLLAAAEKLPAEFLITSELRLEEKIRERDNGSFDRALGVIKILFWDEYRRAHDSQTLIDVENVWRPLVTEKWWYQHVIRNPLNLAWVMSPPVEEAVLKREMLILGMKRLREALEVPLVKRIPTTFINDDGEEVTKWRTEVDVSLLKETHSIVKTLQDRLHGSVAQKHMNLNVNAPARLGGIDLNMGDLDALEKRLGIAKKKVQKVIDVDGRETLTLEEGSSEGSPKD